MTEPKPPDQKQLEALEAVFIQKIAEITGKRLNIDDPSSPELDSITEVLEGEDRISVNPYMIDNYARTQREADRRNEKTGEKRWAGCSCGQLHEVDPKTRAVDTGWY